MFKANSAILNTLLTVLNERLFDNGNERIRVPLVCLVRVCVRARVRARTGVRQRHESACPFTRPRMRAQSLLEWRSPD